MVKLETFWTINVTQSEHDWIAKHLPATLPADRNGHPCRKYPKNWHNELNSFERIDVSMITDTETNESWIEVTFVSDDEPLLVLDTVEIDEPIRFWIDGDTYVINVNTPERASVDVLQRPVDVTYHCPTCGYDGTFPYPDFCDMHGDPSDWDEFECEECGQVIEIESQEWC